MRSKTPERWSRKLKCLCSARRWGRVGFQLTACHSKNSSHSRPSSHHKPVHLRKNVVPWGNAMSIRRTSMLSASRIRSFRCKTLGKPHNSEGNPTPNDTLLAASSSMLWKHAPMWWKYCMESSTNPWYVYVYVCYNSVIYIYINVYVYIQYILMFKNRSDHYGREYTS